MCHKLDPRFFDHLDKMDHTDVCRRSLAEYDPERKIYRITALNEMYEISAKRQEISHVEANGIRPVSVELGLAIIFYLMQSRDIPISNKWVSEKELRGGITFFRGPHAFPTPEIARHCGKDIETLHQAARKIGGEPIAMGDVAYRFKALPRILMAVVFWRGDEEFEPNCKMLMDATIQDHLPLDVIFGLSIEVARRITGLPLWH